MLLTLIAFLIAIFILVVVHEYGHYKMAVLCGVKVERFSVGFGPVLWRWKPKNSETEYVLSALPLGGYVKMVDEREGDVAAVDLPRAFNRQSLKKKAAIVAAGPICNLILAVFLYSLVAWIGQNELQAIIASPRPNSIAEQAGFQGKDKILGVVNKDELESANLDLAGTAYKPILSFSDFAWEITQYGLNKEDIHLVVERTNLSKPIILKLPLSQSSTEEVGKSFIVELGFIAPYSEPVIETLVKGQAAESAGLQKGDKILKVGDQSINDTATLVTWVRAQNTSEHEKSVKIWTILRNGTEQELAVPIKVVTENGQALGKIGIEFQKNAATIIVQKSFTEGIYSAFVRTYEMSVIMLKTLGKMIIGQASVKNISGPISIAEYAGKTASFGLAAYLSFLGVVSVSLGVLNLLPLPVLDGGHLMYYLWEGITKRPVSEQVNLWLQKLGLFIVLMMMVIGVYNDIMRHL